MTLRRAEAGDLPAMVALVEAFRDRLEEIQPVFWRKAEESAERTAPWFAHLLAQEDAFAFVHETGGGVDGFLIAQLIEAPPVYAPGGPTCLIDDFAVAAEALWADAGRALLDAAREEAARRGAVQIVVICPDAYAEKRALAEAAGLAPAATWIAAPLITGEIREIRGHNT